jgi:predicted MPP superfamily phosphohydrolase
MNGTLFRSRTLTLLTLAALTTATGFLALSMIIALSWRQLLPGKYILLAFTLLLFSAGVSAWAGARLMWTWRSHGTPAHSASTGKTDTLTHFQVSRRDFLKILTAEAILGATSAAAIRHIGRTEPRQLQIEEVEVPIVGLNPRLDGLRIVQLSDLHLSNVVPLEHIQRAVAKAQDLDGDLIVITGDYVSDRRDDPVLCANALGELHAPLGVFGILGNRDYRIRPERVVAALTTAGITVLRNQGWPIARDGRNSPDLWLAGLDDVRWQRDDLGAALRDAPQGLPVLLLVHEPDYAARIAGQAADLGIFLQMSGHSHGGQVRLPFIGAPILPYLGQKFPEGLQRAGQLWVYTTRGVGVVRPPIRINCPPEVTALTLRAA